MQDLFVVTDAWRGARARGGAGGVGVGGGAEPPRALPRLQAYAAYYKRWGKTYHVQLQLESVALKGKPITRASALVSAMVASELEHLLLTAGHDLDAVAPPVTLTVAAGAEGYQLLGGRGQAPAGG